MKENSIEEDIKMIEILKNKNLYINIKPKSSICIDCINKNKNKHIEAEVVINEKLEEAINYTLPDYKRVLKEDEELKDTNTYLQKENERLKKQVEYDKTHIYTPRTIELNYVSKQKIKDKIEELKQKAISYGPFIDKDESFNIESKIIILQELLEGRK